VEGIRVGKLMSVRLFVCARYCILPFPLSAFSDFAMLHH